MNTNNLPSLLLAKGGKWLACVREHIKGRFINGCDVIWSFNENFRLEFTIRQLEEIGAEAASGALIGYTEQLLNERLISEHFFLTWSDEDKNDGDIYSNNLKIGEFAHFDGKWIFKTKFKDFQYYKHFEKIIDGLLGLEKEFPHDKYLKYSRGWPV